MGVMPTLSTFSNSTNLTFFPWDGGEEDGLWLAGNQTSDMVGCDTLFPNATDSNADTENKVKFVAYGVVLPVLVCAGVLGDVLNLVVLTRPNMNGAAYVYMRGYAAASLFALLCAVPFSHRALTHQAGKWTNFYVAAFHAHFVLYFGNSCIGIGVVMLLALTVERFVSVCHPTQARTVCGSTRAKITVFVIPLAIFILNSPYLFLAHFVTCITGEGSVVHMERETRWVVQSVWFQVYKWVLEVGLKLVPALILLYLNIRIIITYRAVCEKRRRMTKVRGAQRRQYAEESRLMMLLGGTSTLFFVCMTPMIVLSLTIHHPWMNSLTFQIFRATANVLEVTNFAATFYIYCIFSKDFRDTFLRTLKTTKDSPVAVSILGSMSGFRETIKGV